MAGTRSITFINPTTGLPQEIEAEADDLFGSGTVAQRPASGLAVGDLWLLVEAGEVRFQRWTGSAWENITTMPPSGGSVDNRIARFDGTSGAVVQNSLVEINDAGSVFPAAGGQALGLTAAANRWQRLFADHLVGGVDVFAGTDTLDDAFYVVAQAGTYTLTLPTADEGWGYVIERQGSTGTITLAPGGGDTINGGASATLAADSTYLVFAQDATDWRLLLIQSAGAGSGDVTAAASLLDNSIIRGDGGVKGVQDTDQWTISDAGEMSAVVSVAGYPLTIRNNTASGEFIQLLNHLGNVAHEMNANGSGDGILRVMRNDGINTLEADAGYVKIGPGSGAVSFSWPLTVQGAATGNGLRVLAGEVLGDVALHISDQDDTFGNPGGAIMELEADQGYATFYKTYAQTLADRGVVYGIDLQNPNTGGSDFNCQFGLYRIGGVRANAAISAYKTSGVQTFTTTNTTLVINATHFTADSLYSLASNQITVNTTGRYRISWSVTLKASGSNSRSQARSWVESNAVEIAGTSGEHYCRQSDYGATASGTIVTNLTASDVLRLRAVRTFGAATIDHPSNGTRLTVTRLS